VIITNNNEEFYNISSFMSNDKKYGLPRDEII
jgi:hypothetical protein